MMKYLKIIAIGLFAVTCLQCEKDKPFVAADYDINAIYVDAANTIWVGSKTGLISNIEGVWKLQDIDGLNEEITCFEEVDNVLQIGTNTGVKILAENKNKYEVSEVITTANSGIASNGIKAIYEGPGGMVLYGTDSGLSSCNQGTWVREVDAGLREKEITGITMLESSYFVSTIDWNIWNCKYKEDIDGFSGATQMIEQFNGDYTLRQINCVLSTKDSILWFGSAAGLTRMVGHTHAGRDGFSYFLDGENITSLYEAENGDIWIGKENGISTYDGAEMVSYTSSDIMTGSAVKTICEDAEGNIWIGSSTGIVKYDGASWVII